MKRGYPPLWLCTLALVLALVWRTLGAPLTLEQFSDLETPLWQARVLLPSRVQRVLLLWFPAQPHAALSPTLDQDGLSAEERELAGITKAQPLNVRVYLPGEGVVQMPLESYVCGVVAAEMPAAYHVEALKAQAVAARTRALFQRGNGGCSAHPEADICASAACCQGYLGTQACREKWGAEYPLYRDRVVNAVAQTGDELLTYEGEPITVLYHAISGGKTEDAQAVFAKSLPYLVSVPSAGEENARGYLTETYFTFEEAAKLLKTAFPDKRVTADEVRQTLAIAGHTATGRVKELLLGGQALSATAVRRALGLRSTWFTISRDENGLTFHQRGYGHGVGMSQAGANSMAADGADYQTILLHYYPGAAMDKR